MEFEIRAAGLSARTRGKKNAQNIFEDSFHSLAVLILPAIILTAAGP